MPAPSPTIEFAPALARLTDEPEALPWPQRRALTQRLAHHLVDNDSDETTMALLHVLATDPKWEVRKDVADCLAFVPDDEFPRLAAKLSGDSNAFVRQRVEKALDRRRRGVQSVSRRQRGVDHVQREYAALQRDYGEPVARKAQRLAERLYDVLVGSTVHDMRSLIVPLRSGLTEVRRQLTAGAPDPSVCGKRLDRMARQVSMLELMLEDMRTYAQPTPDERQCCRLSALIGEAHRLALDALQTTGRMPTEVTANVTVSLSLTVEVARHQIVRVFTNVIKNAYESFAVSASEFCAGGIEIAARAVDPDCVEIVVRDNGMGLPPDDLADVRRFVPGCSSKKRYGTGFGLAIAKRKVDDHGGGLAIDSQEDVGTTVTITLPISAKEVNA